jgi:hypothetical protein
MSINVEHLQGAHPHLSSGAGTIGQKWPQYNRLFLIRLVGGGVQLDPLGTAATDLPMIMIMMMEQLVE